MSVEPDRCVLGAVFGLIDFGRRPFVLGICGAQGGGKSTLAGAIETMAQADGMTAATLSIDDLYLTRAEREGLARDVHPLLATRGVPGTHDVELGLSMLASLERGERVALPRFDKSLDDRAPRAAWPLAPAACDLLILEGWCVGARPQPADALLNPINPLEAQEDRGGRWRGYVNEALGGAYQHLFARIDALVLLAAPGFEVVLRWRRQQEEELRARNPEAPGLMNEAALVRFIQHYERLTRHILAEMPARADLLVQLDENRVPLQISRNAAALR